MKVLMAMALLAFVQPAFGELDLRIREIRVEPLKGNIVTSVQNSGNQPSARSVVRIKWQSNVENIPLKELAAGSIETVQSALLVIPCNTDAEVTVMIDPENTVTETNEMNNRRVDRLFRKCEDKQ